MMELIEPIYENGSLSGFYVASIDVPALVSYIGHDIQNEFIVGVSCVNEICELPGTVVPSNMRYAKSERIINQGKQLLQVTLVPTVAKVNTAPKGASLPNLWLTFLFRDLVTYFRREIFYNLII